MKTILAVALFSLSFQLLACPNIAGSFRDEDDNVITIAQTDCKQTVWSDEDGTTTLIADNVERVVEQEGQNIAYGKASFSNTDFILDLRVVYSSSVPNDYPTHFLTSYRIDKYNNLVEKIESVQGTSYETYVRVK